MKFENWKGRKFSREEAINHGIKKYTYLAKCFHEKRLPRGFRVMYLNSDYCACCARWLMSVPGDSCPLSGNGRCDCCVSSGWEQLVSALLDEISFETILRTRPAFSKAEKACLKIVKILKAAKIIKELEGK